MNTTWRRYWSYRGADLASARPVNASLTNAIAASRAASGHWEVPSSDVRYSRRASQAKLSSSSSDTPTGNEKQYLSLSRFKAGVVLSEAPLVPGASCSGSSEDIFSRNFFCPCWPSADSELLISSKQYAFLRNLCQ